MGIDGHFLVGNCRGGGGFVDGEGVVFEPPSVEFACLLLLVLRGGERDRDCTS